MEIHRPGCFDLAGNVSEWTSNKYESEYYVNHGGGWNYNNLALLRASFRSVNKPGGRFGFRCARTP